MVSSLQIICLFSVIVAVTYSSPTKEEHRKSRLILEFDWPEPKKNLKRFPHPKSCVHFYHVKHDGSHVLKKCPGVEIFDYQTLRCREKIHARCWKDIIEKITSKHGKRHFSCPFPWGLYPDTEDCSQLYECLGGKPFLRKCPASTLFDKAERTCVNEKDAMCADKSDYIERDDYRCPYKWGFFTHPQDCSKYYECLRKIPSIRTCKNNMLFDNFERRCLPRSRVKCGSRMNPYDRKAEKMTSRNLGTENFKINTTPRNELEADVTDTGSEKIASTKRPVSEFKVTNSAENVTTEFEKIVTTENANAIYEKIVFTENQKIGFEKILSSKSPKEEKIIPTEIPMAEKIAATEIPKAKKIVATEIPKAEKIVATEIPKAEKIVSTEIPKGEKIVSTEILKAEKIVTKESLKTDLKKKNSNENLTTGLEKKVSAEIRKTEKIVSAEDAKAERIVPAEIPKADKVVSKENPKTDLKRKKSDENLSTGFEKKISTEISKTEKIVSAEIPKAEKIVSKESFKTDLKGKKSEEKLTTGFERHDATEISSTVDAGLSSEYSKTEFEKQASTAFESKTPRVTPKNV